MLLLSASDESALNIVFNSACASRAAVMRARMTSHTASEPTRSPTMKPTATMSRQTVEGSSDDGSWKGSGFGEKTQ